MPTLLDSINPVNGKFIENFFPRAAQHNVKVGDWAPDFELPDSTGKPIRLSDFRGKKVLLVFTRNFTDKIFCPLCYPHLNSLKKDAKAFHELDTEILLVNTTSVEMSRKIAEEQGYDFPVLSDENWIVFELFGLGAAIGAPLPGQFIIDREGIIRFVYMCDALPSHPTNEAMMEILKKLS
ncbi:MAG: redoxin domain-containing protein [Chlorobiales bacterium]|nr:redoxin domain-containing protein [Chlorobiales bacterium]